MLQSPPPKQDASAPSDPKPGDTAWGPDSGRPKWLPVMLWGVLLFYIGLAAFLFWLLT